MSFVVLITEGLLLLSCSPLADVELDRLCPFAHLIGSLPSLQALLKVSILRRLELRDDLFDLLSALRLNVNCHELNIVAESFKVEDFLGEFENHCEGCP